MRDYNKLKVWAKAHALVLKVNGVASRMPREHGSLRLQMRRAAESVATNIVEGCARASQKEFANFLQISIASCSELEYHLRLAFDYGLLKKPAWEELTNDTIEVRRMLIGLIKKVRADAAGIGVA